MSIIRCFSIILVVCGFVAGVFAQAPTVEKVEPPNWWAGHSVNPVRVMVRGENLRDASVTSASSQLKVSDVRVNSRGDYVFFDVQIDPATTSGAYAFDLKTSAGSAKVPFYVSPPLGTKPNPISNEDVIYLIMTDRFADGDSANNKNVDRKNPRAWHGGDFKGITKRIPYLKGLGITAIWLTPWYDNPDTANECDKPWCPYTNYHGYHAIDYYGVENHFGSLADLQEMIRECKRNGIKVIQDQVANHVDLQHAWTKLPPLDNWFNPKSQNTFNDSVLLSPNASQAERDNLLNGWFSDILPDLNQNEPEVSRYLIQNALWWIGMTGIDGIRQDTIQYMPRTFIRDWSAAIRKQYPDYWMVGEVLEEDSPHTAFFQGGRTGWDGVDTRLPGVFDFNLWKASTDAFTGKRPARALRDVLKYDGLYGNINNIALLTGNHDLDRFMSLPGATPEGAMMHMAFTLSSRGIPQIYYGDELGMAGGHDPDNRKDFPGGFSGDARDAFTNAGRTAEEQKMFEWTREWIKIRRSRLAVKQGRTIDLFYDNDAYVFARAADAGRTTAWNLFAFNVASSEKSINFTSPFPPVISGVQNRLINIADARAKAEWTSAKMTLTLPPRSVSAFGALPE
jgi:glycosidase